MCVWEEIKAFEYEREYYEVLGKVILKISNHMQSTEQDMSNLSHMPEINRLRENKVLTLKFCLKTSL